MAKRKGCSTPSTSRAGKKAAEEGSKAAKTSESDVGEDECGQLRCEVRSLLGTRDKLSEQERELEDQKRELEDQKCTLEDQKRKLEDVRQLLERTLEERERELKERERNLEEQLQPLRLEMEQAQRQLLPKSNRLKDVCSAREVENTKHLGRLPPEVWAKVLDSLDENDHFPLALSCRYFRQEQKELVARSRQQGPESGEPRVALRTSLKWQKRKQIQCGTDDYLWFCYKEKISEDVEETKVKCIRRLAAYFGRLSSLRQILDAEDQLKPFRPPPDVMWSAAGGGQLEILKWLRSEGCPWDASACAAAARGGQLEMLKWLRSECCPWNGRECSGAAQWGHLEILKWLRSKGCPWDKWTCQGAAQGGQLEILKWLRSKGCPWNSGACYCAAEGGHLEVLKWLRSEGCPWDEDTCEYAAANGHLDVLKYAHENGCDWYIYTTLMAAQNDHLDCFKYASENGCQWHEETTYLSRGATRRWLKSRFPDDDDIWGEDSDNEW